MKNRQGIGIAMSSAVILSWAEEYYRLNDAKEEAEKRKKWEHISSFLEITPQNPPKNTPIYIPLSRTVSMVT